MLSWLKDQAAAVKAEASKIRNRGFLEAVTAACALVAAADGAIGADEKAKMMVFIRQSDALKAFSDKEVADAFMKAAGRFEFDPGIGRAEALRVVARYRGDGATAALIVRVACVIGGADGNFDEAERKAVAVLCRELGLDPAAFDL